MVSSSSIARTADFAAAANARPRSVRCTTRCRPSAPAASRVR
jgi:hypothetical protein